MPTLRGYVSAVAESSALVKVACRRTGKVHLARRRGREFCAYPPRTRHTRYRGSGERQNIAKRVEGAPSYESMIYTLAYQRV